MRRFFWYVLAGSLILWVDSCDSLPAADVDQDVAAALALAAAAHQAPRPPQAPPLPEEDPFVEPSKPSPVSPPIAPTGYQWVKPLDRPYEWYLYQGVESFRHMIGGWNEEKGEYRDYQWFDDHWSESTAPPWEQPAPAAGSVRWEPANQAPAPVVSWVQPPIMRSHRVLVERSNVVCTT